MLSKSSAPATSNCDLAAFLDPSAALPQPRWEQVWMSIVERSADDDARYEYSTDISRQWLTLLGSALRSEYSVAESDNFLLLAGETRVSNAALLREAENCLARLCHLLPGVAEFQSPGKLVVLLLAGTDDFYTHVSHYDPEGEFGPAGGMHIRGYWPHVVVVESLPGEIHKTLAHELTHAALAHLDLPQWIEEGLAQMSEHDVSGEGVQFDFREVRKQKEYWREHGLELFWSGRGFHQPDKSQGYSYQLAEILVRLLLADFQPRWLGFDRRPLTQLMDFLSSARRIDAGLSAAREHLGTTLGEWASKSLGPGDWEPAGSYGLEAEDS